MFPDPLSYMFPSHKEAILPKTNKSMLRPLHWPTKKRQEIPPDSSISRGYRTGGGVHALVHEEITLLGQFQSFTNCSLCRLKSKISKYMLLPPAA